MLHAVLLASALAGDPVYARAVQIEARSGLNVENALRVGNIRNDWDYGPDSPWIGNDFFQLRVSGSTSMGCPSSFGGAAAICLSTAPTEGILLDGLGCAPGAAGELLIDPSDWIPLPLVPFEQDGGASVPLPIPDDPALMGLELYAQAGILQPSSENLVAFTNRLDLTLGLDPNPLGADECGGAIDLFVGVTSGHNYPYTTSSPSFCNTSKDRWYRYVAPCTGITTMTFCGPEAFNSTDLVLTASDGLCSASQDLADASFTACSSYCDIQWPPSSEVQFETVAGRPYLIRLGGYEDSIEGPYTGTYDLVVRCN